MKRILGIAVVIFLLIYGYSKYQEYQRFHPPSNYDYEISDEIDVNYHDQDVLARYYRGAEAIGQYARSVWTSHKIDVLHAREDRPQQQVFAEEYLRMKAEIAHLEDKLVQSARYKGQGFDNADIRMMELSGMSPQNYRFQKNIDHLGPVELKLKDQGQMVYLVQKKLAELGYELKQDGIYEKETQDIVVEFQEKSGLLPTGGVDALTVHKCFQAKRAEPAVPADPAKP